MIRRIASPAIRLLAVAGIVALAACADAPTAPAVPQTAKLEAIESIPMSEGETCRGGFIVTEGRC